MQSAQSLGCTLSIELFTPRSTAGVEELIDGGRLDAFAALGPSFVSVSGPATAGSLRILEHLRKAHSIHGQLQISRAEVSEADAIAQIDSVARRGVRDVLILGTSRTDSSRSRSGFQSVTELVRFIKGRYGDRIRIAVCGYPRGARGELGDYRADVAELASQVSAGAELVLCLPCFEASTFGGFVKDARAAGVSCPIAPGVLPIVEAAEFRRVCRALAVELPESLETSLKHATTSESVPCPLPTVCMHTAGLALPHAHATCVHPCPVWCAPPVCRAAASLGQSMLCKLLQDLRTLPEPCAPHVYTLNSAATIAPLHTSGFRPLKHRSTSRAS